MGVWERLWRGLVWAMPRRFVYWCVVRAGAEVSTTELQDTPMPEITVVDTLGAWG